MGATYQDVLRYWFQELSPSQWFEKSSELDSQIQERFSEVHKKACAGEWESWRVDPKGRLAEIIVLDQFSRNIYRDRPQAFANDAQALVLAQEAVALGDYLSWQPREKSFLLMPFMHSESRVIHERAVELFSLNGLEDSLKFEELHKKIIDRFGRYPHRNSILGRLSTPEEEAFLKEPGSSF